MFKMKDLLNFTKLYRAGRPFYTGAVIHREVLTLDESELIGVTAPDFLKVESGEEGTSLTYRMGADDFIYGLGEAMGGLNKRGRIYRLYNRDEPNHTPEKSSLYGSHPFLMIEGKESFGLLLDYPGAITIDAGFSHKDRLVITLESAHFDLYLFLSPDKEAVIKELLTLIGEPYLPPAWAFGYQQCRWSYPDRESVERIALQFRRRGIPCDAIYLDIDYMEDYKVFTVDESRFPRLKEMIGQLKEEGIKVIPIIDPGVKIEPGFSVYEDGLEEGLFCLDSRGRAFIAAVWPGLVHLPDFLNPEVRQWWGGLYKGLLELGAAGFWNDMNEPALFYTPEELAKVKREIAASPDNADIYSFFKLKERVGGLQNREEYFRSFYHREPSGQVISHHQVHNLYGFYMALAAESGLERLSPGKRHFLLSRSSYLGQHRTGGVWTGDNASWWEHILLNIKMLINLNMCGFFYCGADTGGFGCDASAELVIRWSQLALFSPLFRNHAALGTRSQEPFAFDEESEKIITETIRLRYGLLPYIYSSFAAAVQELRPFITPLSLSFEGRRVREVEDQFMAGRSLMAAPIYSPNSRGRYVHLPHCRWLYWAASSYEKRACLLYEAGDHYIEAGLAETPIFIKENSLIIMSEPLNYVGEREVKELTVLGLVTTQARVVYYYDDGESVGYRDGEYSELIITLIRESEGPPFSFTLERHERLPLPLERLSFEIYDEKGELWRMEVQFSD